ncbi:glycoside hydrolase family 127 protein [uncultured Maribacter sp.]|uniref:glycoside hydrolase family 127 protein n=1 Tax=uncultured Maribacter sp. TaxID=431308 RepID=UPI00260A2AA2|nr:glycoside hydrolase family 127 protein [uncultured Maribacter sp.]
MKKLLLVAFAIAMLQVSYAQEKAVLNNSKTPYMQLKTIDIDECRWTDGFWAEKLKQNHKIMIPNLGRLMDDPEIIHAYDNFKVAAGLKEGEFRGWSFHDGDFYKYVEALAYEYAMTKDEKINTQMDEIITVIAKAQRPDGYLHTKKQIGHGISGFKHESERPFKGGKTEAFTHGPEHEFYNFGHLMTAACVHYRITGKTNFLNIAIKASDLIYDKFKEPSPELARIDWNPPHYMGLVEMYRTTGNKKYLEVAESFINMLGTGKAEKGDHRAMAHSQRATPIREENEAVGHAGHGNYLYAGVADLYAETGDKELLAALERIWKNVTTQKMYLTGATGPHHFMATRKGMETEAYGKNYELPNIKAYNETCANIGNAMWNWRMFLLNGEGRFADIMELIFYNSALSGISLDGDQFFYTNPLRFIDGHDLNTKDQGERNDFMSVFCCPPNIIRTIAKMHTYAYSKSENSVWVNLYGSNVLNTKLEDGTPINLTQKTNYPWDGHIEITTNNKRKKEFGIMLRIPSWATTANISINGEPYSSSIESGKYVEVKRKWKKGDVVTLDLPMPAQLITADPKVEETRNQVAVKRGPLVYCLESIDLPKDVSISDIVIPQNIKLTPISGANVLSGMTILEGTGEMLHHEDWSNNLYKPLTVQIPKKVDLKLIPYFTWSNRKKTDMSVWLPLKY